MKQQLAHMREQVVRTERKSLAEVEGWKAWALALEDWEEESPRSSSSGRPHHDRESVPKTRGQAEKDEEVTRMCMLKAEVEEMSQMLRQREEEHEEEKARLHAYCTELEEQAAQAMEETVHAQVNDTLNRWSVFLSLAFVSASTWTHSLHSFPFPHPST